MMDRETLEQYRQNRKEIKQLQEEIKTLRGSLTSAGVAKYSGSPGGGGVGDPVGNGAIKLADLCSLYEKRISEMLSQQVKIEKAIGQLDAESRQLLRYRYIMCYRWERICVEMGTEEKGPMDFTTAHRKHRKALKKLGELTQ